MTDDESFAIRALGTFVLTILFFFSMYTTAFIVSLFGEYQLNACIFFLVWALCFWFESKPETTTLKVDKAEKNEGQSTLATELIVFFTFFFGAALISSAFI